jgi:hypothetical protein
VVVATELSATSVLPPAGLATVVAPSLAWRITDAQVVEIVWRNMQCINLRCPLLIFGRQLADEITSSLLEKKKRTRQKKSWVSSGSGSLPSESRFPN